MNTVKVYGSGCMSCKKLTEMCKAAVTELGAKAEVVKEEDYVKIAEAGVMSTPALEVNGKMLSSGKIPTHSTLVRWLKENFN